MLDFSFYELVPKAQRRTKRRGALLRVRFQEGWTGFADCHPWPELGDPPIEEQLGLLKKRKATPLMRQSLVWARVDGEARAKGEPLLNGLSIPKSHFHLSDFEEKDLEGFDRVKIKVGFHPEEEIERLLSFCDKTSFLLRLDFNERTTEEEYIEFRNALAPFSSRIEYCEDPFPFNPERWRERQKIGAIAADCHFTGDASVAEFVVIKPAVQELSLLEKVGFDQKVVVTSYLDHPLGQMAAAYTAAKITEEVCGLLSHRVYEKTPFSERLSQSGPDFTVPEGYGFGFDDLLEKIDWRPL